jgi:hypothetical protein
MTDNKPTLDEQIAYAQQLVNDGKYPEYSAGVLASLKELKRIHEAKMPEEPEIQECHNCYHFGEHVCDHYEGQTVYLKDYDALKAYALRMEGENEKLRSLADEAAAKCLDMSVKYSDAAQRVSELTDENERSKE